MGKADAFSRSLIGPLMTQSDNDSSGTKNGLWRFNKRAPSAGAPRKVLSKGEHHDLPRPFLAMCLAVTVYVTVAIIAIAKAYRKDRSVGVRSVTRRGFLT
jgi:hypothetical protein